jgi:hypothetical protein
MDSQHVMYILGASMGKTFKYFRFDIKKKIQECYNFLINCWEVGSKMEFELLGQHRAAGQKDFVKAIHKIILSNEAIRVIKREWLGCLAHGGETCS